MSSPDDKKNISRFFKDYFIKKFFSDLSGKKVAEEQNLFLKGFDWKQSIKNLTILQALSKIREGIKSQNQKQRMTSGGTAGTHGFFKGGTKPKESTTERPQKNQKKKIF